MTRFFDIVFALIWIIILLPIFIVVILLLLCTGEHEVFYLQTRIGKNRRPFKVFKFVTMVKNSEALQGGLVTQKQDPRVLPVGRILRKTKINELPQLFNVLIGQMSFIGPRPQAPDHFELYNESQKTAIGGLRPGITGIGSVVFRNEEQILERSGRDHAEFHDTVITPYKGDLEIWYSKHKSIGLYFKILILTFFVVLIPSVKIRFSTFNNLPTPPPELQGLIFT